MSMLSRFATLGGGGDPYWNNVSYLLVGNGANGTTTNIVDSSSNNVPTTAAGDTVISTGQSKFGSGSSVLFNVGAVKASNSTGFAFGTGDFTIEFWLYYTGGNGYVDFFDNYAGSTTYIYYGLNLNTKFPFIYNDGDVVVGSTAVTNNTWQYHAVVRQSGVVSIYLQGARIGNTTWTVNFGTSARPLRIGSANPDFAQTTSGNIYDFRVTKGVARYTGSTMTVPTAPLPTYGP